MMMNGRLDGHIVQGHVDQTAVCTNVREADGSWYYTFEYTFRQGDGATGIYDRGKGICLCKWRQPDCLQLAAE